MEGVIRETERFVFRIADPEREGPAIHDFRKAAFGRDFTWEDFQWFNLNYPHSRNRIYMAEEKSTHRIACIIAMLPFRYRVGDRTLTASLATGGATHPDFRGLGLFTKISSLLMEGEQRLGISHGIGFPNPAALPLHLKAGWSVPLELEFHEKTSFRPCFSNATPIEVFDERHDELYRLAESRFDLLNLKDRQVLNWRYLARPDVNYQCFEVGREKVDGFIVLKKYDDGAVRKTHILDFLAVTEEAADSLISCAENFSLGRDLLNLWLNPACPYSGLFARRGFEASSQRSPVILRTTDQRGLPKISSPWLVLGDNDVY